MTATGLRLSEIWWTWHGSFRGQTLHTISGVVGVAYNLKERRSGWCSSGGLLGIHRPIFCRRRTVRPLAECFPRPCLNTGSVQRQIAPAPHLPIVRLPTLSQKRIDWGIKKKALYRDECDDKAREGIFRSFKRCTRSQDKPISYSNRRRPNYFYYRLSTLRCLSKFHCCLGSPTE